MKNAFGFDVCQIRALFKDRQVEKAISDLFKSVIEHLGIPAQKSGKFAERILWIAKNKPLFEYEKEANRILDGEDVPKNYPLQLLGRTEIIYSQVKPFVIGKKVMDFGCGDGKIGEMLHRQGFEVVLCDIYKHPHIGKTGLRFELVDKKDRVSSPDEEFDTTLLLTVFHHADNPLRVLRETRRITKPNGRVIVIEDVYGVKGKELSKKGREKIKFYLKLNAEQQRKVNMFFDHFYNRVIFYKENPKEKVNVPFNYNTVAGWRKKFEENGFKEEKVIHLGLDQPISTIYHTLHTLRRV